MTRLLLPLEHHHDSADLGEDALLVRLKKLPRRVQQVFLLNRLDQLSFAAIAQRLAAASAYESADNLKGNPRDMAFSVMHMINMARALLDRSLAEQARRQELQSREG